MSICVSLDAPFRFALFTLLMLFSHRACQFKQPTCNSISESPMIHIHSALAGDIKTLLSYNSVNSTSQHSLCPQKYATIFIFDCTLSLPRVFQLRSSTSLCHFLCIYVFFCYFVWRCKFIELIQNLIRLRASGQAEVDRVESRRPLQPHSIIRRAAHK